MYDMSFPVGDDLKLNVVRIDDKFFQINLIISKRLLRFMTRAVERRFETGLVMRSAHPAAAAAAGCLDHHRVAEFPCNLDRLILCFDDSITPRCHRDAGLTRGRTSSVLVTHRLHRTRGRPDELDVAAFTNFREMRVLSEEPIAGMNRVNVADFGRA